MESEEGVYEWVKRVVRPPTPPLPVSLIHRTQDKFGFSLVSGIPPTSEATDALLRRIAFIRETHYGGFWDFTADLQHGDLAYSDLPLRAHTDTTYFTDVRSSSPPLPPLTPPIHSPAVYSSSTSSPPRPPTSAATTCSSTVSAPPLYSVPSIPPSTPSSPPSPSPLTPRAPAPPPPPPAYT